mmetsp:Transcript_71326/g.209071  ORF Transcript_71326/g.209071 Transcript_71326/m.209071 type:complete len:225 (+) Transcript_71326:728-1402(+)
MSPGPEGSSGSWPSWPLVSCSSAGLGRCPSSSARSCACGSWAAAGSAPPGRCISSMSSVIAPRRPAAVGRRAGSGSVMASTRSAVIGSAALMDAGRQWPCRSPSINRARSICVPTGHASSARTTPSEKTSVSTPYLPSVSCCGLAYAGVPTPRVCIDEELATAATCGSSSPSSRTLSSWVTTPSVPRGSMVLISLASPKSPSCTRPVRSKRILEGLMSRCAHPT